MTEQAATEALTGLRVIELGDGVAPAFAGRWLAAFGADVLKIEPPGGSWTRRYAPTGPARTDAAGALATYLDAGKRSVTLDPDTGSDRAALRDLLTGADALVHDQSPARLAALGLEAAAIRARHPNLVEVALVPFGAEGPYAEYAATSITLLALGGYQFLTGEPGRPPLMLPGFQPEYLTGFYGIIAALAGIFAERQGGPGRRFEITSMEALASLHQFTTSQWLYGGSIRSRHGNRWENLYPITMLPCRDGYVALSMPSPEQWERLCHMIERPDLLDDPRFTTPLLRRAHADALDAVLLKWLRTRDMADIVRTAQEQWRLPVNPYEELDEVLRDPQYMERGFWVRPAGDESGPLHPGMPVIMSETPWTIRAAPALTERTGAGGAMVSDVPAPAAPRGPHPSGAPAPLRGLRVLDFTRVWSGPLCTRILADLGAEVIKIEPPVERGAALPAGAIRPVAGPGKLSRNKLSVGIDLRRPEGRDLLTRLAEQADVLVENFSARVMPNFGLGHETLRQINPRLIYLAMSGYGATGPYREYLGYGSATEAMTGLTALLGYPGEEPLNSAIAYPDPVGGLSGASAVLTALVYRERTGRGQFLDLSQLEPSSMMLGEYFLAAQLEGCNPPRTGNDHPEWAPHGTYPTRNAERGTRNEDGEATDIEQTAGRRSPNPQSAFHNPQSDGWISFAVRSDEEWRALCRLAGPEGLATICGDPAYATAAGRRAHRGELDAAIASWTRGQEKFALMERLQGAGIPAGAVLNAQELVENPHLAARGFMVNAEAPEGGDFPMPGTPITVDGAKRRDWHAAPYRGEHNRPVLKALLGLTDAEIDALTAESVLVDDAPGDR